MMGMEPRFSSYRGGTALPVYAEMKCFAEQIKLTSPEYGLVYNFGNGRKSKLSVLTEN